MAKWTLKDMIFQARTRLDEFDEDTYSTEELTAYFNEAIQQMSKALKRECVATLTITGKQSIDFRELFLTSDQKLITDYTQRSHNFFQLHSLYLNGVRINAVTADESLQGTEGFYFFAETINFEAPKTGEIRAMYIKQPSILRIETDISDVPERYQHIPLGYVIAKAKQKDGDYGLYDYDMNRFLSDIAKMEIELNSQENASGVSVINVSDYDN